MNESPARTRVVVIGAGGHAAVIVDIVQADARVQLVGLTDERPERQGALLLGVPILGDDAVLPRLRAEGVDHAVIAVGATTVPGTLRRRLLFDKVMGLGFVPWIVQHEKSIVARSALLDGGVAVMAGAVINPGAAIGRNVIVNTGAIVEHGCRVGDHVHICPGARLAADVQIGDNCLVGIGSIVIQGVRVGEGALIGAGSVVVRDVPSGAVVMGVPARTTGHREG